ncbi:hypothetical protein [Brevundimonas sp. NIBR11]|uniref:hypothetical protein n=1 Tax=Brevundimonas sp. NIBR11 TaxID=3015999 RepID=UPI0022F011B4|nr:hypothetical protein [Brevundimonas sp. NIBR11]WGM30847.1 hypothetical protein KKHFBJBL_01081 [Brevundimonas sp. NIBR11]
MLADALRSEAYRFARNRTTALWSIVFFPVVALVIGLFGQMFMKSKMVEIQGANLPPNLIAGGPLDLGQSLVSVATDMANPITLLFVLIGMATLYAGDYRWETWRLITARNSRLNLVLGKVGVAKLLTLVVLAVMLVCGMIGELGKAIIFARPLTFSMDSETAAKFFELVLLSYIRIVRVGLLGLLAAVMTRSLIATLFVPIVVSIAQAFAGNFIAFVGWTPQSWQPHLLLPNISYDVLKGAILHTPSLTAGGGDGVWPAVLGLLLWCAIPLVAAIAWFTQQDLSKE